MPIKIPKGFTRRKSSGNALDEVDHVAVPSFRVLERPRQNSRSFDGGTKLAAMAGGPASLPRPDIGGSASFDHARTASNRGSGGSNANSTSTGGYYDTASSSRLSTSSTVPSSIGVPAPDDASSSRQHKPLPSTPVPPVPESHSTFSLRAGSRTFSFGGRMSRSPNIAATKPSKDLPLAPEDISMPTKPVRSRAMTASSYASTATPPKLDADFVSSDPGEFSGIFDGIGTRRSVIMEAANPSADSARRAAAGPDNSSHPASSGTPALDSDARPNITTPSPIHIDRQRAVEPSARSGGSHTSTDGLMASASPPRGRWPADDTLAPPVPRHHATPVRLEYAPENMVPGKLDAPEARHSPAHLAVSGGLNGTIGPLERRSTMPLPDDKDARLVMESRGTSSNTVSRRSVLGLQTSPEEIINGHDGVHGDRATARSAPVTPPRGSASSSLGFSPKMSSSDRLTQERVRLRSSHSSDEQGMPGAPNVRPESRSDGHQKQRSEPANRQTFSTPAHRWLRSEEDLSKPEVAVSQTAASSPGDEDKYHSRLDNRDTSRTGSPMSQMGTPGGQPTTPQNVPHSRSDLPTRGTESTHSLPLSLSLARLQGETPDATRKSSEDDDEDEDVPLGILAAHGFPSKNRPPARLSTAGSVASFQTSNHAHAHPPAAGSTVGEPSIRAGRTSTLPVFARNLPRDPYQRSSLVHPPTRESLVPPPPPPNFGPTNQGGIPPGGLVGVIAGEEKARAMRRGTPNAQGGYGLLGPPASFPPGHPLRFASNRQSMAVTSEFGTPEMGSPAVPRGSPAITSADQAQLQMSQQMTEMMRLQIQWMQQMMQMQGFQTVPNTPPLPQPWLNVPSLGQPPRPASVGNISANSSSGVLPAHQRAMSMLDPSMSGSTQFANNPQPFPYVPSFHIQAPADQGYAPSIAPSERSNVGMPARYRPVSIAPSTASERGAARASTFTSGMLKSWAGGRDSPSVTKVAPKPSNRQRSSDDDDDDEGWEEMKKKREKIRSTWRFKKESGGHS